MPMQFAGATLWTEDINNLLPFYRDTLGLNVIMASPTHVVFGTDIGASPWLGLGTHSEVHGRNQEPARTMIGLDTPDIQAEWQRLQAAGVEFIETPTQYEDLWIATCKDPEGNLIQLFEYHPR